MTEQPQGSRHEEPNTAAIRAEYRNLEGQGVRVPRSAFLLLDALDAARAKREEALASVERWMIAEYESSQRAEVAEAEVAQWRVWADDALTDARARAEAAEENLSFAQQRAADNGLRAEIGERKVIDLVDEVDVLDLKDQLRAARAENRQLAYDKREIAALFEADHDGWKRRAKAAEAELLVARGVAHTLRVAKEAAEENLSFAQQRAADNGLRAQIGEEKITALVAEVRDLKSRIAAAAALCVEAAPYGYIHDALTGPIDNR